MKLTESQLRKIIREELDKMTDPYDEGYIDGLGGRPKRSGLPEYMRGYLDGTDDFEESRAVKGSEYDF